MVCCFGHVLRLSISRFSQSLSFSFLTFTLSGAGKTTCLGVLTGLLEPTSGDCRIGGRSIIREARSLRRSVGYCPQDSILFDRLSVREHIAFCMRIKGIVPSEDEVRRRAVEVGLGDFYSTRAGSLSHGNRRKLSLAIAFCGDPALMVLDEPTSGMGELYALVLSAVTFLFRGVNIFLFVLLQTPRLAAAVGTAYDGNARDALSFWYHTP